VSPAEQVIADELGGGDVFGSVIDTAIGLIFVYLILSLICSSLNEIAATYLSRRPKFLQIGLRNILDGQGDGNLSNAILNHPLVKRLGLQPEALTNNKVLKWVLNAKASRPPAYIPAKSFVTALLDHLAPEVLRRDLDPAARSDGVTELERRISEIQGIPDDLKKTLTSIAASTQGKVDDFIEEVEGWFDDAMERVSGWYKRYTQVVLLVLGLTIAVAFNVDTIEISKTLWQREDVRDAVVEVATKSLEPREGAGTVPPASDNPVAQCDTTPPLPDQEDEELTKAETNVVKPGGTQTQLRAKVNQIGDCLEGLEQLQIPMGWTKDNQPATALGWLTKILGILLTAAALSLGAPFWFDLLSKVARVRGTGPPPDDGSDRTDRSRNGS
jgi:hypothetical protein